MSKTIEEILAPKPVARLPEPARQTGPRIYAYAIDDPAHTPAPTVRLNTSPGQRPGYANPQTNPALKGRPNERDDE